MAPHSRWHHNPPPSCRRTTDTFDDVPPARLPRIFPQPDFHVLRKLFGFLVAAAWLAMASSALGFAAEGREGGHPDLTLWWSVIAALLAIAAGGAIIGTIVHLREGRRED